jgi:phospholipase A1
MKKKLLTDRPQIALMIVASILSNKAIASTTFEQQIDECLINSIKAAASNVTLGEIKKTCLESVQVANVKKNKTQTTDTVHKPGLISKRFSNEDSSKNNPFALTPNLMNYILPALTTNQINPDAYDGIPRFDEHFEDTEAKIQLSIKVPLTQESVFIDDDVIYFGFTLQSWWQVYSSDISKPFRETNYKPEVFYLAPLDWHPFDGNSGFGFGIEHQSNGRTQELSRSWNRVYALFLYEKENFVFGFQPWFRIPESDKKFEGDPEGDDNPDITDFMGNFELSAAYKWQDYELTLTTRQNFSHHKGAVELGFTFPLWGKLLGYTSVFSGYGESLIDYNHKQTRVGVGIALNNMF